MIGQPCWLRLIALQQKCQLLNRTRYQGLFRVAFSNRSPWLVKMMFIVCYIMKKFYFFIGKYVSLTVHTRFPVILYLLLPYPLGSVLYYKYCFAVFPGFTGCHYLPIWECVRITKHFPLRHISSARSRYFDFVVIKPLQNVRTKVCPNDGLKTQSLKQLN